MGTRCAELKETGLLSARPSLDHSSVKQSRAFLKALYGKATVPGRSLLMLVSFKPAAVFELGERLTVVHRTPTAAEKMGGTRCTER